MLDPLYNSLAHKCQLPVRLIKELNTTDESKAHHISGMAEEIIRNREFTEILFESICEIQGKTNYLEFVFNKIRVLDPSDERNFYPML